MMSHPNFHYREFKDSYLFSTIYRRTEEYLAAHPGAHVLNLGVGDVSRIPAGVQPAGPEKGHCRTL